ncbi:tryptophan 2,3-dioxygenase [Nocardia sp. NPDC049526]|uniref:tryptophan 2,3-dioxygenase n=1 Tax=Nocardia sp. NPDC049526 TaxID=3364316 RepID=UPI00379CB116
MSTAELMSWLCVPAAERFPYDAVLRGYHSVGKHFVPADTLDLLDQARAVLPGLGGPWPPVRVLAAFLDCALDKLDNRYDYPTYLALRLLELPVVDDPIEQALFARSRCDRRTVQLLADVLAFELAAIQDRTTLLPTMRPPRNVVNKRIRHGLRAIRPALERLALDRELTDDEPVIRAQQVSALVHADMSFAERRVLELSMLPVYTMHDEYLFLRVLQTFETTFSLLAMHLRGAVAALAAGDVSRAVYFISNSTTALREAAPLFSMLATMQIESFRTFRQFTEGASAIQSRSYKLVESLCRRPDAERVDSPAYHSVPEVRGRVLAGQECTLDDAYAGARSSGDIGGSELARLAQVMADFSTALLRWRATHYRLALRMLGGASGTGYTEGTPYLAASRTIPVFITVESVSDVAPDKPIVV